MKVDRDKLLRRRLYLQRYITSLTKDVSAINAASDKKLIAQLNEFILDADEKTLIAVAQQRKSNGDARMLAGTIKAIVKEQRDNTIELVSGQMGAMIEREGVITASAMGGAIQPSMRGIASLPVAGKDQNEIIAGAYRAYELRVIAEVVQNAMAGPQNITRNIRGSAAENFRDGLFYWRDNRLLNPNIDQIVNGNAANASSHVYNAYRVEEVEFLSTLDFRACEKCTSAAISSPYKINRAPAVPQHPRCRCVLVPWIRGDQGNERPYVLDDRPVSEIPKSERDGKIGTTRDTVEQFFNRMTEEQRVDYMGPSRAALWKAGKINSIRDLVNQRTLKPLRLDQLPKL